MRQVGMTKTGKLWVSIQVIQVKNDKPLKRKIKVYILIPILKKYYRKRKFVTRISINKTKR
jgi:hypothetical protein